MKKPEAARDATRAPTKPARIVVAGGVYPLSGTLLLDGRDSLVTWEAAPGAKPVFHGGRAITGWTKTNDGLWKAALPDKNNVQLTGNHHDRNHQR